MECSDTGSAPGWWALSGTPGTGKSTVARRLLPQVLAFELRDLAAGLDGRVPGGRPVPVRLPAIRAWMRRHPPSRPVVVAGYLTHRLPVRGIVVLRCHPRELADRLRTREIPAQDLRDNVQCEALDTVSGEARCAGPRVWELDTTGVTPAEVARRILRLLVHAEGASDPVDWLADPTVPPFLLGFPR
jgi:adenylate kinase